MIITDNPFKYALNRFLFDSILKKVLDFLFSISFYRMSQQPQQENPLLSWYQEWSMKTPYVTRMLVQEILIGERLFI